ncbi:MAG: hypothetical protein QOG68_2754 [Solirubrobacteraceae bacterium]|jgi:exopolysaccharide biosynthesis polyprenyl glycosylphosphotransferase|nr:hypothetical protein [Solirubrobacteraceae bacterium]
MPPPAGGHTPGRALVSPLLPAFAAGALAAAFAEPAATPLESGLLVLVVFAGAAALVRRDWRHLSLLPFTARLLSAVPVLIAAAVCAVLTATVHLPDLNAVHLLAVTGLALVLAVGLPPRTSSTVIRAAVLGSPASAEMLSRELAVAGISRYQIVGVITPDGQAVDAPDTMPVLGLVSELGSVVGRNGIGLLLMTTEAPRIAVFDELANCLHLPVRLWELAGFYEDVFGHVPVAEIDASWFQYMMHPRYHVGGGEAKRALDLVVSGLVTVLTAPLLLLLIFLVRRDGGPALFRQVRIGESGRPFTMLKLRTMRELQEGDTPQWASRDDPRITRFGGLLRRTHLDELPQVINVLRGDMSLVGPRPEQPEFVSRLEGTIPFYTRRHLVKPGVTGWAQVRCGYAGSDTGSAWKLCHDLYYLKHRSFALDLAIIVETFRTLVADRPYDVEPAGVAFILRPAVTADSEPGGATI